MKNEKTKTKFGFCNCCGNLSSLANIGPDHSFICVTCAKREDLLQDEYLKEILNNVPKDLQKYFNEKMKKDPEGVKAVLKDISEEVGIPYDELMREFNDGFDDDIVSIEDFLDQDEDPDSEQEICEQCHEYFDKNQLINAATLTLSEIRVCPKCSKTWGLQTKEEVLTDLKNHLIKPKRMVETVNETVIGQEKAKKQLAVQIYNHYNGIVNGYKLDKNNILVTGPTGSGKTYLINTIANILNIPFVSVSAKSFTTAGFKGRDVEEIIFELVKQNIDQQSKVPYGIVFIDEIDKIKSNSSSELDCSGREVQESLLTMLEGDMVSIQKRDQSFSVNTDNILFILGGAFNGIENIVKKRKGFSEKRSIGFETENVDPALITSRELRQDIIAEDLNQFGIIEELTGRCPIICNLMPLTPEEYAKILLKENGLIDQCKKIAAAENKKLVFSESAIKYIAEKKTNNGARGLKSTIWSFMNDFIYDIDKIKTKTIKIDKDFIEKNIVI